MAARKGRKTSQTLGPGVEKEIHKLQATPRALCPPYLSNHCHFFFFSFSAFMRFLKASTSGAGKVTDEVNREVHRDKVPSEAHHRLLSPKAEW